MGKGPNVYALSQPLMMTFPEKCPGRWAPPTTLTAEDLADTGDFFTSPTGRWAPPTTLTAEDLADTGDFFTRPTGWTPDARGVDLLVGIVVLKL